MRALTAEAEDWEIDGLFTISRGARTHARVVVARFAAEGWVGAGECVPYARYGESVESVLTQIAAITPALAEGADRYTLQKLLPAGAARNAVDCALWDWERQKAGAPLHILANRPAPGPMITAYTLSLGAPDAMGDAARKAADRPLLKVKLGGEGDPARIAAVRAGAPQARLIVDANEAWSPDTLDANLDACRQAGVELIEQPLPAGRDEALAHVPGDILLCADESVQDSPSLDHVPGWYRAINVKLDKTGGLTDAIALFDAARARGLKTMVGCMVGTSLAMAPAVLLGAQADYVDLDGPLLLKRDREPGLTYRGSLLTPGPEI